MMQRFGGRRRKQSPERDTPRPDGVFLQALLDQLAEGVVVCDADGANLRFNRAARELLGLPPDEPVAGLPSPHYTVYQADGTTPVAADQLALRRALAGETVRDHVGVVVPRGRPPRTLVISGAPILDPDGRALGASIVLRDVTEQHRAEQALAESERRLREAQDVAHIGSWEWDTVRGTVSWTDELYRIVGLPREHFTPSYDGYLQLVHPEDRAHVEHLVQQAFAGGELPAHDHRILRADGAVRMVHLTARVERDAGGRAVKMMGVIEDVTERHDAEQRFRGLLEAAPDAMVIVDESGRMSLVNSQTERLFGWERAELLGHPIEMLIPERFRSTHEAHRNGYVGTPRPRTMGVGLELNGRRRDGTEFPVEISLSPLKLGSATIVTAAIRDASERKRAEAALIENQKRLAEAQEIAHLGSWEWNITQNAVRWSDELYRIYGLVPGALAATYEGYISRIHPDDRARVHEAVQRAYRTCAPFEFEERVIRPSGEVRWLHSHGRVTTDARGQPVRMTGTCQDITERKRADEELAARAEALARSNEDLEHFADVASHDLQEPLRTVASYTQLLERRFATGDAGAREFVRFITDAVHRMQDLLGDLLTYSRVTRDARARDPVDLGAVLDGVLANLDGAIRDAGATVTHDPLPTVPGDRTQLSQVLQNLVANAVKFRGGAAPRVHVSAARQDGEWVIAVRDNGIGIEPEHFEKMFVLFQRLHPRERYPGTGLGLAICKKIVERHGGRIWVASPGTGQGTTFSFTLPEPPRD